MWQRYNQTSHIFEKSTDNGATWQQLPLNASIISEGTLSPDRQWISTAYTDVTNNFTNNQNITGDLNVSGYIIGGTLKSTGALYLQNSSLAAGDWIDWYPVMSGTGFSIGDGSYHGRYTKIYRTILFELRVAMGSTTVFGSSGWTITLPPFESLLPYIGIGVPPVFHGTALDASAGKHYVLFTFMSGPAAFGCADINSLQTGPNTPFVWAPGDNLHINGFYESTG